MRDEISMIYIKSMQEYYDMNETAVNTLDIDIYMVNTINQLT